LQGEVEKSVVLQASHRTEGVGRTDGRGNVGIGQAIGLQLHRIECDLNLRGLTTGHADAADPADAGEQRTDLVLRHAAKVRGRGVVRDERVRDERMIMFGLISIAS